MRKLSLIVAALATASSLALVSPSSAAGYGLFGNAVCPLSDTDHANIPNATISGPNVMPCENVPWFVHGSTGSGAGPCQPSQANHYCKPIPAV